MHTSQGTSSCVTLLVSTALCSSFKRYWWLTVQSFQPSLIWPHHSCVELCCTGPLRGCCGDGITCSVLQSSALRSRSQRAVWQALHSHLMLLQSLDSLTLQPETVNKLIKAASADAAAAASDVLPPLLNSLRFTPDKPGRLCACVSAHNCCLNSQSLYNSRTLDCV